MVQQPPAQQQTVMPQLQLEQHPDGVLINTAQQRSCQTWFMVVFAIFWNLITWVISAVFLFIPREVGVIRWFPLILMSVFVLIGLALIVYSLRLVWVSRAYAPATLQLAHLPLSIGETASVRFRQQVRASRDIERVSAKLSCREWVRYKSGTDTATQTHTIWQQALPDAPNTFSADVDVMWQVQIPSDQPPSFAAPSNAIQWHLDVTIHIRAMPDASTSFLLAVLPVVQR